MSGGWTGRRVYSREFHRNKNLVRRRSGGRCEVLGDRPELPWGQRSSDWARCPRPAVQCDHIVPQSQGGGDGLLDLQDICHHHHSTKTQAEARAGKALRSRKRPPMPPPGLRRGDLMKVQFTTATAGRELNEVADLPDHEAEFLLANGAVRRPGKQQPAQGTLEGSANLAVVRDTESHTDVPNADEDERDVDLDERANPQSGKGDQPIPEQVIKGEHPFEGERDPYADDTEESGGLENMSLRELKSYIERLNEDDEDASLPTTGNKGELAARIRQYESERAARA